MFRVVTILIFIAALMLGDGLSVSAKPSLPLPEEASFAALNSASGTHRSNEADRGAASHCCHDLSCTNYLSPFTSAALVSAGDRPKQSHANDCDWRSLVVERDPPVPRFSI